MYIILPNANGKLFLSNTIIACDDPEQACTEFRFLIMNTGSVTANAWYKVSIVGGGTLYSDTVPNLAPQVGSSYIDDWICALPGPGSLPVGTHTIKVEVGPEGMAATDSYTEDIYVIEEVSFVTEEITTQFSYGGQDYPLESASIHVIDWDTNGSLYNETCYSHWLQVNYGCDFAFLEEGVEYEAAASKDGYHTNSLRFIAEGSYVELWLTPREPTVVTEDASLITPTSAQLNGLITDMDGLDSVGFHFTYWPGGGSQTNTHTSYPTGTSAHASGITGLLPATTYYFQAVTINETEDYIFHVYGGTKQFTTLAEADSNMYIILPNENGKLFLNNTITACDDSEQACTEFRFLITNTGTVTASAWYQVSVVGGDTPPYTGTVPNVAPGVGSYYIEDYICALPGPGSLPVGTHTVKVEAGVEGSATATDTYTEDIYVIEEGTPPSGVETNGEVYINVCGDEITDNCITADVLANHFGNDSKCSFYLEYWSEGDAEHNFTTPVVVPYDPEYDEYGSPELTLTACIHDCEKEAHIRAVASNSFGTSYSETVTPLTVRLETPTEITQTSVTLNAYIVSLGGGTDGLFNFKYGSPSPDTYTYPFLPILDTGALSRTITGLVPNTTYNYYLYARGTSAYPVTLSATLSFTTLGTEPQNDATFVSQTVPLSMAVGESHEVSITMRNTGTSTWTPESSYRLGLGNTIWGLDRVDLPPGTTILPGAEWTFTFSITAPTEAGDYNFQWIMVEENVEIFGEPTENLIISVSPPLNDAAFVSQTVPLSMAMGESYEVSITMQNTGSTTWACGGQIWRLLGSWLQDDDTIWGPNRVYLPAGTTVLPGAEWTFTFSITAPTEAGDYNFQWRMLEENVEWFGEPTENLIITVAPSAYDITFIATAPGISDLHDVDVNDVTDPQNPLYLGKT